MTRGATPPLPQLRPFLRRADASCRTLPPPPAARARCPCAELGVYCEGVPVSSVDAASSFGDASPASGKVKSVSTPQALTA